MTAGTEVKATPSAPSPKQLFARSIIQPLYINSFTLFKHMFYIINILN